MLSLFSRMRRIFAFGSSIILKILLQALLEAFGRIIDRKPMCAYVQMGLAPPQVEDRIVSAGQQSFHS